MSNDLNSNQMPRPQMPRPMAIFIALIAMNAVLVGWSVLQKHLWALPIESEVAAASEVSDSSENDSSRPLTAQERLDRLEAPEIVEGENSVIEPDDPLLDEIRKQAARHFPELDSGWDDSSGPDPSEQASEKENGAIYDLTARSSSLSPIQMSVLETKLECLGELNGAALHLVHLARQQLRLGQEEQARSTMQQCRQIQRLMADLLQQ